MRADRAVAVLLLMQSRGRVTAAEIAAGMEVSVVTAEAARRRSAHAAVRSSRVSMSGRNRP
ncbi:hypothetical protein [Nonomuraea sp. NPDC049400]|uniref:hypothetical protein n=1 Tax=Nonomuraea sp. NPDC049400 TaxID=3364352 RepID=UPI0037917905